MARTVHIRPKAPPKPADAADELCGFLHLEPTRCVICVSGAGGLRFAREFALKGQDGLHHALSDGPDLAERLVMELTRSLLYFRQISQGGAITRLDEYFDAAQVADWSS